jgi:putative ABC transport system permease protein
MLKNYLKIAWRNLWKSRTYSAINIIGLAIGMAACIVILLFVFYERSFDRQHTKNIYRLDEVQKFPGMLEPQKVALSMYPMGPTLQQEFPQIKQFVRVNIFDKPDFLYNNKKVTLPKVFWTDSSFFNLFNFPLLQGDKNTLLQKPNSIVLTTTSAQKIFGNEDPMGKTVTIQSNDTISYTVTGIMADVPANSHLQFDGLLSFATRNTQQLMKNWGGNWVITYFELSPNADIAAMEKKFPDFLKKHMNGEGWKFYELFLQSLPAVHAGSTDITHDYLNFHKFDGTYTNLFSIIAIIVLVIACINFMNLSTARSAGRAREVGVRKAIGALRFQLALQFIGESVLLCFISLILALALVKLALPYVANLSQRDIDLPLFGNSWLIPGAVICAVVVGILAGLYPAVYLSSFRPTRVLKGSVETGKDKGMLRNFLVVSQFTGAIVLIIGTVFAIRQLRFMEDRDPGFNKDQVVTIPLNFKTTNNYDALKTELLNNTLITGVTASWQKLGNNLHQTGVRFHGDGPVREMATSQVVVDPDYLTLYKIPLIAGRNFSKDYATDNGKAYIINESMAKELTKDKPNTPIASLVGKQFGFGGMDSLGHIIGIAKDFNFNSLHHKIETLVILDQKDWGYEEVSVRINGAKSQEAITYMQDTWKKINPGHAFEYEFLDDHFKELYQADQQVSKIIGILAGLAIIISCLGLFGLASYTAERRIREIGIRKVLGASVQSVVGLLSKDFLKLVFIANLIAWPIAWFLLSKWLQDFAYRVNISWWVFAIAGVAALLIALLTVSFQAIKAALTNPVKSLRSE